MSNGRVLVWIVSALVVCALAAGGWYWLREGEGGVLDPLDRGAEDVAAASPAPSPSPLSSPVEEELREPAAPSANRPAAIAIPTLPDLDRSDALVRQLVGELSQHPRLLRAIAPQDLIRKGVASVINVAEGKSPAPHLKALKPKKPFETRKAGDDYFIAPQSYERYDEVADAVASIDPASVLQIYWALKPLIQEAYANMGYPGEDFDVVAREAIERLLETPVIEGDLRVAERVVTFEYADESLEGLDAAQRHFLRMGPRNVRLIQDELRQILEGLEAAG